MLLAAVCTVALVVLSRRATLRQVNARLAELSAELRAGRVTT
jgi:ABC-type Fe3+ transport system permease subunit